jgi:hypothetical protein
LTTAVLLHPTLLLLGLAAAAVPIVIHLLNRRRVRRLRWAAMEWLLAALRRRERRLRVENWLLLFLRVAALALLGLGLARWVVSGSEVAALLRDKRSVVLLLDTSYSVGAKDGARAVFDRVREEAEKVVAGLGAEDTVAVLASNDVRPDRTGLDPAVLAPRTLGRPGAARAREALGSLRPTEATADWPAALALAVSPGVAAPEDVNRVVYWVTDLQASDWRRPDDPATPDAMRRAIEAVHRAPAALRVIDVSAGGRRRNLTLAEVSGPVDLFETQPFSLSATVRNHGREAVAGAQVRVFVDGSLVPARTLPLETLPAADAATGTPGSATVAATLPATTFGRGSAGSHEVRVEVTPPDRDAAADVLALDSERRLAVDVRARVRIAAWTRAHPRSKTDPRLLLRGVYVGEAEDRGTFDLRFAEGEAALRDLLNDPDGAPDLVILANTVPQGGDLQRALVSHVRAGGGLLVFVGDRVTPEQWNPVAHVRPETRLLPFPFGERVEAASRAEGGAAFLDLEHATEHPLSKVVAGPGAEWIRLVPPRVWGRMPMLPESAAPGTATPTAGPGDDERVVLRFRGAHGEPGPIAVAEGRLGQGRALWVATAVDDAWFDQTIFFLPVFLTEAAVELTRGPDRAKNLAVGGRIVVPIARDAQTVRIHVPGRGSETPRVRPQETESDRPVVTYDRTGASGTYRLTYERASLSGGSAVVKVEERFAVNPDPREGDLRAASPRDVETRAPGADVVVLPTYEEARDSADAARQGEVSPYVLLAVLGVLLLESWLAMRFNRRSAAAEGDD